MKKPYIEQDCTFVHEGRQFTSGGAVVTNDYLIAYPGEDGVLTDWHGNTIGAYRVVSSKPAVFFGQHSWQGSRYYFMRAVVNGSTYALRGFGVGMIARGKRVKGDIRADYSIHNQAANG
jgi:hypothetical protein